jgi:hypothetical protein
MVHDECHPDVSLSHWEAFRNQASPYLIEKVLDRSETRLPYWYLPLARGAAIPSPYLLHRAGYRSGSRRAPGWLKPSPEELFKDVGKDRLIVARCKPFWWIARNAGALARPHDHTNFALVHFRLNANTHPDLSGGDVPSRILHQGGSAANGALLGARMPRRHERCD